MAAALAASNNRTQDSDPPVTRSVVAAQAALALPLQEDLELLPTLALEAPHKPQEDLELHQQPAALELPQPTQDSEAVLEVPAQVLECKHRLSRSPDLVVHPLEPPQLQLPVDLEGLELLQHLEDSDLTLDLVQSPRQQDSEHNPQPALVPVPLLALEERPQTALEVEQECWVVD